MKGHQKLQEKNILADERNPEICVQDTSSYAACITVQMKGAVIQFSLWGQNLLPPCLEFCHLLPPCTLLLKS